MATHLSIETQYIVVESWRDDSFVGNISGPSFMKHA